MTVNSVIPYTTRRGKFLGDVRIRSGLLNAVTLVKCSGIELTSIDVSASNSSTKFQFG